MTGLDTNVLVRYVMQDDARQSARGTRPIESFSGEEPGFVPLVTVLELAWVLSGSYGLGRAQVAAVPESPLPSKELVVDRTDFVAQALGRLRDAGADFGGALIERIAVAAGCPATVTFDAGAAKTAGMTLVP